MGEFQYQWWDVDILEPTGRITLEVKAKSKENAIRQIEKYVRDSNSEANMQKPVLYRIQPVSEVYWDTLKLDRIGYQRRW